MSTDPPIDPKQLVGGSTNQPTNGSNPQRHDPHLEALAVSLLIEAGVAMPRAKQLAAEYPFVEIRRQVFHWLPEHRRGSVQVGALISRIQTRWAAPDPDRNWDRDLWNRYRTPAEKQADAAAQAELDALLDAPQPEPPPVEPPAPPAVDGDWAIAVQELAVQLDGDMLRRARAEIAGEQDGAEVWRITLDASDVHQHDWISRRGAVLIRKTLASIRRRAVLVDVVL